MRCSDPDIKPIFSRAPLNADDSRYIFQKPAASEEAQDALDRLKARFKSFSTLYRFAMRVLSPVYGRRRPLRCFLAEAGEIVVNIGSGNQRVAPHVINVDLFDYEHVDVVADIHDLPFKDGSVDGIMSIAVLEHVRDTEAVVREMHRVLKPGGRIYNLIPFMQPFHASPHDYRRYTLPGIRHLHRDFEEVESGVGGGPVSGFLWVFQEWLATLLSFGCVPLRNGLYLAIMLLTWPLKYLDLMFRGLPTATNIASSFYYHGRKR